MAAFPLPSIPPLNLSAGGGGPSWALSGAPTSFNDGSFTVGTSPAGTAIVGGLGGVTGTVQQFSPYLILAALVWLATKHKL